MATRKKRRGPAASYHPSAPSAPKWTGGYAIVWIDGSVIRSQTWERYTQQLGERDRLTESYRHFELVDLPAYASWEASKLGPLLTAIRDLEAESERLGGMLDEVQDTSFYENCSMPEALRRLLERRARAAREEAPDEGEAPGDRGAEENPFDEDPDDRFLRAAYEEFLGFFRMFGVGNPPSYEEFVGRQRAHAAGTDDPSSSRRESAHRGSARDRDDHGGEHGHAPAASCKDLYRKLVRTLHPDRNGPMSEWERDLWDQAQQAYQAGDAERLEALWGCAQAERLGERDPRELPVAVMLRMLAEVGRVLHSLRNQIRTAKRHPAWDFGSPKTNLAKLEARNRNALLRTKRMLECTVAELKEEYEILERRAQALADSRARRKARPRKKSKPHRHRRSGSGTTDTAYQNRTATHTRDRGTEQATGGPSPQHAQPDLFGDCPF